MEGRFLALMGAAIAVLVLGTAFIWAIQRMRAGQTQRKRKGAAARRRVENAVERGDLARSTISVPDRFGAIGVPDLPVQLTAEPQPGDLSAAMVAPSPPFDLTGPGASDALQDWETATIPRRRTMMVRGYLSHPLPRVRAEALDLVGSLGSDDSRLTDHLAVMLRDDAESVRRKAASLTWSGKRVDDVVGLLRADTDTAGAERAHHELVAAAPRGRDVPSL